MCRKIRCDGESLKILGTKQGLIMSALLFKRSFCLRERAIIEADKTKEYVAMIARVLAN